MGKSCLITYSYGTLTETKNLSIDFISEYGFDISAFDVNPSDEVNESIYEIIKDYGFYDDLICDALNNYDAKFKDDGTIDINEISENLYITAKKFIEDCDVGMTIEVLEDGTLTKQMSFDVIPYLKKIIDERNDCEDSYIDVGGYVESLLFSFTQKATWNVGFRTETGEIISLDAATCIEHKKGTTVWKQKGSIVSPIIWYGEKNKIMKRWAIDENTTPELLKFWFRICNDEGMCEIVPDWDESFDIWYFFECGREFPNFSEIIEQCPVKFSEDDTTEIIKSRIENYFITYINHSC